MRCIIRPLRAVAVKCSIAYSRGLDFAPVAKAHASRFFLSLVGGGGISGRSSIGSEDLKTLKDFLFRY
ncbi:hypothetical protein KIP88_45165 [Bradyrhizobium sp. SRL28]|uniref:hypothetical protein n=1 Tax=Bradyrhizobium sp. SRL28 TaxID=2836178 RepID=UPI001BDE9F21|nr:hypothetical protein [Bradyrhizobium sp. SRL28]MBT1517484.1 hypothetical protein [Bradyrhizobium sp. SRL28]